jgi:excinuclease ABC subunit C
MSTPDAPDRFNEEKQTYTVRGVDQPDLEGGVAAIRNVLKTLPTKPGVYRMHDARGDVLYVGKARALKNRVTNYTQVERLPQRLRRMVSADARMTIVTTNSARPRRCCSKRSSSSAIARPTTCCCATIKASPSSCCAPTMPFRASRSIAARGAPRAIITGRSPAPARSTPRSTRCRKLFLLRSCTDSFFNNRDRPCLLYQIKRCSAPCVGRIDAAGYAELVTEAKDFLGRQIHRRADQDRSADGEAAEALDFERAAMLRDRLRR